MKRISRNARFSKKHFEEMMSAARKVAQSEGCEVCGLIVDNGLFLELIRVRNKVRRGGGFSFYVKEVRAIQKAVRLLGHEIVGTFHSHPVGLAEPGTSDLEHAVDDSLMLIFDVVGRSAQLWRVKNRRVKRLAFTLIGY